MIGLEAELNSRKKGKKSLPHAKISVTNIAGILGSTYPRVQRKLQNGSFTVEEAVKIFKELDFTTKEPFEAFIYLFTQIEEE